MLQMSIPNVSSVFQTYVANVCLDVVYASHICCKYFYLDVAYVSQCFKCFMCFFASVSDACVQVFHMSSKVCYKYCIKDVSKVDQVLCLPPRVSVAPWCLLLSFCCLTSFSDCRGGGGGGIPRVGGVNASARSLLLLCR
jgi:hypothetical protein